MLLRSRRVLVLALLLVLAGLLLAFPIAWIGHVDTSQGTAATQDHPTQATIVRSFGWWFYPCLIGGGLLALGGIALVPAHVVARRRAA
jgi:hypothetical protein